MTWIDWNVGSTGTVKPFAHFNATADAEALEAAMKGKGSDEKKIMDILCLRSNGQRQQIKRAFRNKYNKELSKELIKELKSDFENFIVSLLYPPDELDAAEIRKAMSGLGTREHVLIEVMCSRTPEEIQNMKYSYRHLFGRDAKEDLSSETSGDFRRLMVALCKADRDRSWRVDPNRAKHDAETLFKAGEAKLGTDEAKFIDMLSSQNFGQLQLLFQEYEKLKGHDIETAISKEFSGDIGKGLDAIVKCVKNRPTYFAERFNAAMKGAGTDEDALTRLTISRSEVDMTEIVAEYERLYKKSLQKTIESEVGGRFKEGLVTLVRGAFA